MQNGLHRSLVTANQLPDLAPWSSLRELCIHLHVLDTCTCVLLCVPGRASTQLLWLCIEQLLQMGPEDVCIYWKDLPLLRPERSLAAYDLPANVELQVQEHAADAFRLHLQWGVVGMRMYVNPDWLLEQVRRSVAFQLGIHPHQVTLHLHGEELMGGRRCSTVLPESLVTVRLLGFPDSLNCDICADPVLATSLCPACGRGACCAHRHQCRGCLQFVCARCSIDHVCLQLTRTVVGHIFWHGEEQ